MLALRGQSRYVTGNQRQNLWDAAVRLGLDPERNCNETELSGTMEGLYIKVEENGQVVERMKFVRAAFLQCVDWDCGLCGTREAIVFRETVCALIRRHMLPVYLMAREELERKARSRECSAERFRPRPTRRRP